MTATFRCKTQSLLSFDDALKFDRSCQLSGSGSNNLNSSPGHLLWLGSTAKCHQACPGTSVLLTTFCRYCWICTLLEGGLLRGEGACVSVCVCVCECGGREMNCTQYYTYTSSDYYGNK